MVCNGVRPGLGISGKGFSGLQQLAVLNPNPGLTPSCKPQLDLPGQWVTMEYIGAGQRHARTPCKPTGGDANGSGRPGS